jgi:hypothetical protein
MARVNILMDLVYLFTPFLQFTEIYITSFWSVEFTSATAMNQKDKNLGKSIFVHFDMKFLTTLTGIFDFSNLIFQTWFLQVKNPVQTWKKVQLDISNWRIGKIKCR